MSRRRRANAKRKTRVASSQRYNNVVRFPTPAMNDSFYGEADGFPFGRKVKHVLPYALPFISSVLSPKKIVFASKKQNHGKIFKTFLPALSEGILDNRFYHFNSVSGVAGLARTKPNLFVSVGFQNSKLGFAESRRILTCVRRTQRKQVLHALGKTGKSGQKKAKWNSLSYIQC